MKPQIRTTLLETTLSMLRFLPYICASFIYWFETITERYIPVPSSLLPMVLEQQILTTDVRKSAVSSLSLTHTLPVGGGVGRRSYVLKTLSQEILCT